MQWRGSSRRVDYSIMYNDNDEKLVRQIWALYDDDDDDDDDKLVLANLGSGRPLQGCETYSHQSRL